MASKTFESRLDEALRLDEPPPRKYIAMEKRLNEIVEGLQKQIDNRKTKAQAQVALEPGHLVSVGQQFNMVVHIPNRNNYRDTLFRAYIPPSGSPVTLDFIGDDPERADTPEQLEERVLQFLSLPPIRAMIRTLREMATKTTSKTG